jgi:hypothetical protein
LTASVSASDDPPPVRQRGEPVVVGVVAQRADQPGILHRRGGVRAAIVSTTCTSPGVHVLEIADAVDHLERADHSLPRAQRHHDAVLDLRLTQHRQQVPVGVDLRPTATLRRSIVARSVTTAGVRL